MVYGAGGDPESLKRASAMLPDMLDYKTGAGWSEIASAETNLVKGTVMKYGDPETWAKQLSEMRNGEGNLIAELNAKYPDMVKRVLEFSNLQLAESIFEHRKQNPLIDLAYKVGEQVANGKTTMEAWQKQLFDWAKKIGGSFFKE